MCLASNVVNKYNVLLPHGRRLSEHDVNALQRKLPDANVRVVDPVLDEMVDFEDNSQDHAASLKVRKNIAILGQKVGSMVRSGVSLDATTLAGMERVVDDMVEYLQQNPVTMAVINQSNSWDDYLQEHCANVFYLSLLVGNTIRNYIKRQREEFTAARQLSNAMNLTPLGTAALFHDIGMHPIENLYSKQGPLTPEELEAIRAHPANGANMLPSQIDPLVKLVVRMHHEHQDGSGYPEGIEGDKIHIFARIIRVADAYSAAISDKVYAGAKSPIVALYEMTCGKLQKNYDSIILRVFASIVQPFPIGAKLKLSNGKYAVVVRHDRRNSFNPELIIAFDELGDPMPKDLMEKPFWLAERDDVKLIYFGKEDIRFLNNPGAAILPLGPQDYDGLENAVEDAFSLAYP